jgi:hypothetical protein
MKDPGEQIPSTASAAWTGMTGMWGSVTSSISGTKSKPQEETVVLQGPGTILGATSSVDSGKGLEPFIEEGVAAPFVEDRKGRKGKPNVASATPGKGKPNVPSPSDTAEVKHDVSSTEVVNDTSTWELFFSEYGIYLIYCGLLIAALISSLVYYIKIKLS